MRRLICGALVVDRLLPSRHMRGGLAGAGTATMPRRHGVTRPPTPLLGVESLLFATPFSSFTSTCWNIYTIQTSSLVFYLSLQDVSTTVLRD